MDKDALIEKWLNGSLNKAEKEAFSQLEDADFNMAIIQGAKAFKAPEVDDFEIFKSRYNTKSTNSNTWLGSIFKIACVLLVGFGLYFLAFGNDDITFSTEIAEKISFELPDRSVVELNAASEVSFNKKDWKKNRELVLNGEAYFKVAKGKTFTVMTELGKVTVVGTEFNVKQRQDYFMVQCFEGIVEVVHEDSKEVLHAGDTYKSNSNRLFLGKTQNAFPDWTANKSSFTSTPFLEVLDELKLQYDVELQLNNVAPDRLFTGGFPHDNLSNALLAITKPMNLTYSLSGSNQVVIHGENK